MSADAEQLTLLLSGPAKWNEWRQARPLEKIRLHGANLSNARLIGADLSNADLSVANLSGAMLDDARLIGANLREANLCDACLTGAMLAGAGLIDANLRDANLTTTDLHRACLYEADLRNTTFNVARLTGAELTRADLQEANFTEANLAAADLSGADLRNAKLIAANLRKTLLPNANLSGANLVGADLAEANLTESDLTKALAGRTLFGNLDLSVAKNLHSVKHLGPSTIGVDTIYKSKGDIPEIFLRGAGVPDTFITFAKSLVGKPVEFYSCFISYSSVDHEFAAQLYADLQARGVRCWFAPEDMKIGDKIRPRIDESIRLHEKLLLVLSEHSIKSAWVEKEVETAFNREVRDKRAVLFPIRIDNNVMTTEEAWAADIRRARHIGDFREWSTDHVKYLKAFERLMRDLKPA